MNKKTYKICILALLLTFSIILSYIEFLLPLNLGIPGIKLGLSNLLTLLVLYTTGKKDAILITLLRVLIMGLLFTGISSMLYSLAGAITSLTVMLFLYNTHLFKMITISLFSAIFHNIGQILLACYIFKSTGIVYYLPVLVLFGCIAGIIVGLLAYMIYQRTHLYIERVLYE